MQRRTLLRIQATMCLVKESISSKATVIELEKINTIDCLAGYKYSVESFDSILFYIERE